MVHLTDHMEGRTCCLLAVCAHFVQRKVILAYCGHTAAHGSNMPQVFRWCLDAVRSELLLGANSKDRLFASALL